MNPVGIQHNTVWGFGKDVAGSMGIDTLGYISGALILDNELKYLDTGIRLRQYSGNWNSGTPGNAESLEISDNQIQAILGTDLQNLASNNYIDHNNICASGPWAVLLQAGTSENIVTKNTLKAYKKWGNATVQNSGTDNTVAGNN